MLKAKSTNCAQSRIFACIAIAATAVALLATTEVHAQVVSATARYDRGVLIVRGRTAQGGQFVSLNRAIIHRSNTVGRFVFRQTTLPRSCEVSLRSAGRTFSIPIENCLLHVHRRGISIDRARYEAGVLRVRGRTAKANQIVTLDGRYRESSNNQRRFQFRVQYRPHRCIVRLRAGNDIFHARVANCRSPDR